MAQDIRQSTFAGGEVAPTLYGRSDLKKYDSSLRRCRNTIITQHGAALNRPGTVHIAATKGLGAVRLIPFTYSQDVALVLEFGELYIRFYRHGAQILSGGVPLELATPFHAADLPRLKFAQVGDVVTLVHPSYPPQELKRLNADNLHWSIGPISFALHAGWLPGGPSVLQSTLVPGDDARPSKEWAWAITTFGRHTDGLTFESEPTAVGALLVDAPGAPWSNTTTYARDTAVTYGGYVYLSLIDGNLGDRPDLNYFNEGSPRITGIGNRDWLRLSSTGVVGTSGRAYAPVPPRVCLYTDRPITIDWTQEPGALISPAPFEVIGHGVYRGRNGVFGWVGDTDAVTFQFRDDGQDPDWTRSPPKGTDPFAVTVNGVTTHTYPALVSYAQQRRVFVLPPNHVLASATGQFSNFDVSNFQTDDGPFDFWLASRQYEEIRSFIELRSLIALTSLKDWTIAPGGAFTPSGLTAQPNNVRGASWLDPILAGATGLYVQNTGTSIWELGFDYYTQGYLGNDVTMLAQHLFLNHTIVDWAYGQSPYSIVWAVRNDGRLLGFSYMREQELAAWHWHDTAGTFENVCAVPEGQETGVYVVVNRGGTRQVERFASRVLPRLANGMADTTKGVFLDSAVIYSGPPTTTLTGLAHLNGASVSLLGDGVVYGPYTVSGGQLDISADADPVSHAIVGLPFVSELETLDLKIEGANVRSNVKSVFRVSFEMVDTRGFAFGPDFDRLVEWKQRAVADGYGPVATFTGLDHVRIPSKYEHDGRVAIRHTDPLPFALVGLGREVDIGGD